MSEDVLHLTNCPCGFASASATPAAADEQQLNSNSTEAISPPASEAPHVSWQEQIFRLQFDSTADDASVMRLLSHLTPIIPRCLPLYLAYYAFRTRGYTLHEGLRLGVDYVVYPIGGANHWHAQFSVLVGDIETVQTCIVSSSPSSSSLSCPTQASSQHVLRTLHINNKQKKTVLFARVFSSGASASNPFSSYSVSIIHLSNWFPSRGRQWNNKQDGTQSSHKLLQQQQQSQPSKKQKLHQPQQDFSDEL